MAPDDEKQAELEGELKGDFAAGERELPLKPEDVVPGDFAAGEEEPHGIEVPGDFAAGHEEPHGIQEPGTFADSEKKQPSVHRRSRTGSPRKVRRRRPTEPPPPRIDLSAD